MKTPKIYFWDTALAIQLLGIETPRQLAMHPMRGALFENWVIVELMKARFNHGKRGNLFFWRNNTGLEVDALIDRAGKLMPIEIKSGATLATDWFKSLNHWLDLAGDNAIDPCLVFGGETPSREGRIRVLPWRSLAERETALISL